MKVLFVGLARTIWLFDLNLMNPAGLSLQGAIEGLATKYRFAKAPKNLLDLDEQKALSFKAGTFVNSKGRPILVAFNIHNDGLVVDTSSSTDDSTEFLVEITEWMAREYHLVVPSDVKKAYVSQIDVESDISLSIVNPKLTRVLKFLETNVKPADGRSRQFEVGALNFWTEDVSTLGAPAIVKFERKFKAPFSANHYFAQAPLQTRAHLELLGELETLLKS
jgi:hypothetical protein